MSNGVDLEEGEVTSERGVAGATSRGLLRMVKYAPQLQVRAAVADIRWQGVFAAGEAGEGITSEDGNMPRRRYDSVESPTLYS